MKWQITINAHMVRACAWLTETVNTVASFAKTQKTAESSRYDAAASILLAVELAFSPTD